MQELPDEMRLISNLRSQYLSARNDLNEELKRKEEYINELLNRIKEKKSNVFVSIDPVERFENQPNFETICKIIDEHNSFVGNYEEKLKKAASKIEYHCLAEKQDEYEKLNSSIDELKIKETEIEDSLAQINNRIEELSAPSGDPIPSADRLTHLLAEMLGRAELEFKCAGERYQVLRNGRPAERLSEGEIRAATLIHFFESVENQDLHGARPIIIIDDPVSSLDANVFAGISAYLWSEVVTKDKIDQLFLLTHNFELFRQWDIQISGLPKDKEKDFSAKRLQLTSTYKNKVREPKITKWKSTKGTRSTYVQLFISLKEALDNCQNASDTNQLLELQLLYPNAMRRFLESFLAFRIPNLVGNFNGSMRKASELLEQSDFKGDRESLRIRLTRFAHMYSHQDTPDMESIVDPHELPAILKAVFTFVHALDPCHFESLCNLVDADVKTLIE